MHSVGESSVLITGANGFLGQVIADLFKRKNISTIKIVEPGTPSPQGEVFVVNLEDPTAYHQLTNIGRVGAVIHLAAVLPGQRNAVDILHANEKMTAYLLDWSLQHHVPHFIFASTCNIYGYQSEPCSENTPPAPPNPYAVSKIACEYLIRAMTKDSETNPAILRIAAPYGPSQHAETVIRRFVMLAASGESLPLMSGGQRSQDFVYESDVAAAFFQAFEQKATGVFNLAGGRSTSMRELAEIILRLFHRDFDANIIDSGIDPQQNYRGRFPIEAARRAFGYQPQVSLEEGIRQSAEGWGVL